MLELPPVTMLGALCHYVTHAAPGDFQPMKANFGILPPLEVNGKTDRRMRAGLYAERGLVPLNEFLASRQLDRDC